MIDINDQELSLLFKKDALKAYEILFKKYYKLLCLHAVFFLMDEAEAEDLVLDLFTEMWENKIYQKIDISFKAYLYRAVRNKCINATRKNKLSKHKQKDYSKRRRNEKEIIRIEQRELSANIHAILKNFPDQRLKAFTLVYLDNKKYQQAADEMGLSINSVKTHLKLALKTLREKLNGFK